VYFTYCDGKTYVDLEIWSSWGGADNPEMHHCYIGDVGNYSKPWDGIPKSDFASEVQASLGKADTALQSVPEEYVTETELEAKGYVAKEEFDGLVSVVNDNEEVTSAALTKLNDEKVTAEDVEDIVDLKIGNLDISENTLIISLNQQISALQQTITTLQTEITNIKNELSKTLMIE
jgi:hypothetical protein